MNSEVWAQVRGLLEAVTGMSSAERAEYLATHAPSDSVREQVEQLLGYEREADVLFTGSGRPWNFETAAASNAAAGQIFGHYRLIQELGRGGMGAVYLAERADGSYEQRVAVKVLQENNFTPRLAERFAEERQNLARLADPGIARLLDGGVSPDGRPFLVLEYVDGKPIDVYCDEHHLGTDARLRLFLKVAAAVQAAHQMLVLHLDLKPANILVTADGEPRLLDFGISRVLGESAAGPDKVDVTLRLLTPRYASPEQASGEPLTVASDVFSLSTLLYRLLTGRLPYPLEGASPLEAGRILLEAQPTLPSKAAAIPVGPELKGDLDVILLKGLRKEPARRYPTVAALADDIRRHLDSTPVQAHADRFGYRAGKFLRRHRGGVIATAAVTALVLASVVAVARFALIARRQREIAERANTAAQRHLKDMRALAHSYVFDLDPQLEQVPGTIPIRHFVLTNAQKYLEQMSQDSVDDDDLAWETAQGYNQIAQVQDSAAIPSLSDPAGADASYAKGIAIQQRLVSRHPNDLKEVGQLMRLMRHRANVSVARGDVDEAYKRTLEAWNAGQPLLANPALTRYLDMSGICTSMAQLMTGGPDDWNISTPEDALPWAARADEITDRYRAAHPEQTHNPAIPATYERTALTRAWVMVQTGRMAEARPYFEEARRQSMLTTGEMIEDTIVRDLIRGYFATYLLAMHDAQGAAAMAPRPRPGWNKPGRDAALLADDADAVALLAQIDLESGRVPSGRRQMRDSLEVLESIYRKDPSDPNASSALAWDSLRLGQERALDAATRKALLLRSAEVAEAVIRKYPSAISADLVIAQAHLGLGELDHLGGDQKGTATEAAAAETALQGLLRLHPAHVQANQLRKRAQAMKLAA